MSIIQTFKGFIFLDINRPIVAWECYRGVLISPYKRSSGKYYPSLMWANIVKGLDNIRMTNELLFECVRVNEFPSKVSRLNCLYAFDDYKLAKNATKWSEYFELQNLVEVGIGARVYSKHDVKWIDNADRDQNGLIVKEYIEQIKKYWRGEPYDNSPHWECLIEGHAIIWGTKLRQLSYENIRKEMSASLGLLELSRIAEECGLNLGHVCPHLLQISDRKFKIGYIIDVRDMGSKIFLRKLEDYKGPVRVQDVKEFLFGGVFTVPDLTKYEKIFTVSNVELHGYSMANIHSSFYNN